MSGAGGEKQPPLGVYKCKEMIHDLFLQTGQRDMLMAHIRQKTTQDGWTWTMRDELISYIKKRGPNNVNVSHMVQDLAPLAREMFPSDLKKELVESMFEVSKDFFTIDDTLTPITDPDNTNAEAEKTFLYQSRDVKPDPGIGVGVEVEDSPPPSPQDCSPSSASTTPRQSPGPAGSSIGNTPRQSPVQNTSRQSPGAAPRHSPASTAPRPLTPQSLPPPPVLRAETTSATKSEPAVVSRNSSQSQDEEEEPEEEDDDEDARNNEEDEEDELMDV